MNQNKISVLVVEDSLVFRSILVKYINQDPELNVVAVANDPFEARDAILKYHPDIMTLDIELPKMDGIEFLRKLMPQYPLRTIVISSLSNRVFDALQAGAVDFVAKPSMSQRSKVEEFVSSELPGKIKIAARAKLKINIGDMAVAKTEEGRKLIGTDDLLVAIGASTGGTEATASILEKLGPDIPGVVVTQHMPEGFTKMYAERLDQRTHEGVHVKEAQHGEPILPGHVYIAPGGERHMEITRKNNQYFILLKETEKLNGHRPSVEVLFQSVAKYAGNKAVGVILTGMGGDGAKGLLAMRREGAKTIGQDESSCVVYGMPKVAYEMGAVEYQEALKDIPQKIYYCLEQIQKRGK